jgi:hypothetical protein
MPKDGMIDLAEGNVFYSEEKTDADARPTACAAPAKLAYAVNDVWEEVIHRKQTGQTLRDLFGLAADVELLRDRRSPDDEIIGDHDDASYEHGCVFRTRKTAAPPQHEPKLVDVTIDGEKYKTERGINEVKHLRNLGKVPPADVLAEFKDGKFVDLPNDGRVEICGGELFASHVKTAGSS